MTKEQLSLMTCDSDIVNHSMEQNKQEFYELDENGQPVAQQTPSSSSKIATHTPWLRYAVIVFILIIIALLAVWGIRSFIGPDIEVMTDEELSGVYDMIEGDLKACAQEDDEQYCIDHVWTDIARELGEPAACLQANGDDASSGCVSSIAFTELDLDVCSLLAGSDFENCSDNVKLELLLISKDYAGCDELYDDQKVNLCRKKIDAEVSSTGDCEEYGVPEESCLIDDEIYAVITNGDSTDCNWLIDRDAIATCHDIFSSVDEDSDGLNMLEEEDAGTSDNSVDTDGDGLNDYEEVKDYETNPTLADTDGDGYSDGEEVGNGFDPLDAGTDEE
jgi:hypothetical protein